jgi:hypothetical protein
MQPVNRLPPAIRSRITRYVLNCCARDVRSIIPLTHVCRYWREFIISAPEHWTSIPSRNRRLAVMCLKRAKSAPLEITLYPSSTLTLSPTRGDHWLAGVLMPYLQNINTLRVSCVPSIEFKTILPNFPRSTPNLQSLTVICWGNWWGGLINSTGAIDPFDTSVRTLKHLSLFKLPLHPSLLKLRTLTELDLHDFHCKLHLDTLLDFLEKNHSLESATLEIRFIEPSLHSSRRQTPIKNRLRYLQIVCSDTAEGQALISGIALPKGATLEVHGCPTSGSGVGVNDILSGISTTHLSNLPSPTFMEYHAYTRDIRLVGPNGSARFCTRSCSEIPFVEFPLLPLANIRRLHFDTRWWDMIQPPQDPAVFHHLSFFPALETLTIAYNTDLSHLLSTLFSNPASSSSLEGVVLLGCSITEKFMEELTQFASDRRDTTSTWLRCVVIHDREGGFPSASVRNLEKYVPVVDVRIVKEIQTPPWREE